MLVQMKLFSKNFTFQNAVHTIGAYSIASECNLDHQHHNCCSLQHSGETSPAFFFAKHLLPICDYEIAFTGFNGFSNSKYYLSHLFCCTDFCAYLVGLSIFKLVYVVTVWLYMNSC